MYVQQNSKLFLFLGAGVRVWKFEIFVWFCVYVPLVAVTETEVKSAIISGTTFSFLFSSMLR